MATKYGVKCTDGRTIVADAFAHEDQKRVPLLWRHDDRSPENVLGHAILTHVPGVGVRTDAYFNKTPRGEHSRQMVEHEDIDSLSIKAINLRGGAQVTFGNLTEVSLVPFGANKEARIESVYIQHEDGMIHEIEDEAIIYMGDSLTLTHEDDSEGSEDAEDESEDSVDEKTLGEIYDSLNEEQKLAVGVLIKAAQDEVSHEDSEDSEDSNESDEDPAEDTSDIKHEGVPPMTRNVFDKTPNKGPASQGSVLTHEQISNIFDDLKTNQVSSMKKYLSSSDVLQHVGEDGGLVGPYGITNIEALFPEPKQVTDRPEWIKRDDSWVAAVLTGVKSVPFSRIKSASADVTHEEARAKGYIKGTRKKNEYFQVASRTTDAKTIYKRQGFDRDDLIDLSTFDVVAWVKEEMRWMLQEEVARAILFGDNRAIDDPDKIDEDKIRPIATDDEFYTARVYVGAGEAPKSLAKRILRSRKLLKGATGKPTLYTNDDLIVDMLLMEDKLGRRYYETEAALAAALGVRNIVMCDVLEEGYTDEDGNLLLGVLVNLNDYWFGANKGGQETMFEDFDIDFNQHKYLIETRRSGALTRHRSAVSIWEGVGTEAFPVAPTSDGTDLLIPSVTGVIYSGWTGTNEPTTLEGGSTVTLPVGETYYVEATSSEGYRLPFNVVSDWSFAGPAA